TLQGNYMAKQTEQEAVKDAASERFWGGTDTPGPSKGF
ncbi:P-type conjugative transfer protein TrbJ, partial [Acinetobacter baumannii]|nr:P-type conjugative transfer protein TrbJ [Acinetobacter baumannii]